MAYKVTNVKKFARFILIIVLLLALVLGISIKSYKKKKADEIAAEKAKQEQLEEERRQQEEQQEPEKPDRPTTATPSSAYPLKEATDDYLVLVNKTHKLDEGYQPTDLVTVLHNEQGVGTAETRQMRKAAADALEELIAGAEKDGYSLVMRTGYRSYAYQQKLFSDYVKNNGEEKANEFSARAGESEHQTGLCCDIGIPGVYLTSFTGSKEADWIVANAYKYGFILRFPEGKKEVTGYNYESWHIRYIGKEAAEIMHNEGILTLEEYLGILE